MESTLNVTPAVQTAILNLWNLVRSSGEIIVSLREENARLVQNFGEIEKIREENTRLEESIREFGELCAMQDEQILALQHEISAKNEQYALLSAEMSEEKDKNARLSLESALHESTFHDVETLQIEAENARKKIRELEEKLLLMDESERNAEFAKAELVRRNVEINNRTNEAARYKEDIVLLENKIRELSAEKSALEEISVQNSRTSEEYSALQTALEKERQEREFLERKAVELERELEAATRNQTALLADYSGIPTEQRTEIARKVEILLEKVESALANT